MINGYRKVGLFSIVVLINIGLVGCNLHHLFGSGNDSKKTGYTVTGSNFGNATINETSDSDNSNEEDDASNDNGDIDVGEDVISDSGDSGGGDDTSNDSEESNLSDDKTNDSGNTDGESDSTNDSENSAEGDADDNGNSDGGNGGGVGTAGCVNYPRPVAGQKTKLAIKDENGTTSAFTEFSFVEVSDTSLTEEITLSTPQGFSSTNTNVYTFTIENNYRDITQKNTTTFSPYDRVATDTVCEGQTWQSTYTETDGDNVEEHSRISTIEAVNVPITIGLGTFNTFRLLEEDDEETTTSWIDIATGALVSSTTEGEEDVLELIEITNSEPLLGTSLGTD